MHARRRLRVVLWFLLFLPAACGDGTPVPSVAPGATARSVTVVLVPSATAYQASAVAAFDDGSSREVTTEAIWTSAEPTVATVSSAGQVTVLKAGSTEIRATYQAVSGGAVLTVAPPPPPPPPPTFYTVSGSVRDSLDGLVRELEDSDICCLVELLHEDGGIQKVSARDATYAFVARVQAGDVRITVKPSRAYAEQTRTLTIGGDTTVDFELTPLPFRLWGDVADPRTEARGPACPARIEILDGLAAGRSATTVPTSPFFEFSGLFQPETVRVRFSAPGGYETQVKTLRLRGTWPTGSDNSMRIGAALACPGCPGYYSIQCP